MRLLQLSEMLLCILIISVKDALSCEVTGYNGLNNKDIYCLSTNLDAGGHRVGPPVYDVIKDMGNSYFFTPGHSYFFTLLSFHCNVSWSQDDCHFYKHHPCSQRVIP